MVKKHAARGAAPSPGRDQATPGSSNNAQTDAMSIDSSQPGTRSKKKKKKKKPRAEAAPPVQKFGNLVWRAGDASTSAGQKRKADSLGGDSMPGTPNQEMKQDAVSNTATPLCTQPTTYIPITESQLVPPHLRHPFRSYPPTTKFDITPALTSEPVTEKRPSEEYLNLASAAPNAYWTPSPPSHATHRRKLLVLDLNGALLVRSARTEAHVPLLQRKVFPRPFLHTFLDYLLAAFGPKKTRKTPAEPQRMRAYEVCIWSSAQPRSIDEMVGAAFLGWGRSVRLAQGTREQVEAQIRAAPVPEKRIGRVLGVWSRAQMGLTSEEYFAKSATLKDLDKLWRHFQRGDTTITHNPKFYHPDPAFLPDPTNTLLIDDSTDKASLQPFNHLPILDFDLDMLRDAAQAVDADNEQFGLRKTMTPVDVLRLVFGASASDFYHQHIARDAPTPLHTEKKVDGILLAIIGILAELADVESIPAWIAAGGLQPDIGHTFTKEIAGCGWEYIVKLDTVPSFEQQLLSQRKVKKRKLQPDAGEQSPSAGHPAEASSGASSSTSRDPANHTIPQTLPSHPDYRHWYNSPAHVLYWVRRGLIAVAERGVSLQHGMSGLAERLDKAERERGALDEAARLREDGNGVGERIYQRPV